MQPHRQRVGLRLQLRIAVACIAVDQRDAVRLLLDLAAPPAIQAAAAKVRWTVPLVAGHPQVLLSVMAVDLVPLVQAALAAGEAGPRALLERLVRQDPQAVRWVMPDELTAVDPGLESFADIDTADDLRQH